MSRTEVTFRAGRSASGRGHGARIDQRAADVRRPLSDLTYRFLASQDQIRETLSKTSDRGRGAIVSCSGSMREGIRAIRTAAVERRNAVSHM
jgi:hypothetical protein